MRYLRASKTGEMFLARKTESRYDLSGPMTYQDIAQAIASERVGEHYEYDGTLVPTLDGLTDMSEIELQRCETEASVSGVKVGDGWLK